MSVSVSGMEGGEEAGEERRLFYLFFQSFDHIL